MKNETTEFLPSIASLACSSEKEPCVSNTACSNISDEDMLERAKFNKECFACLMERYDAKLKRYIRRMIGGSEETIEDIVQEVFMKVYLNMDKFDRSLKFSSWIYRIAHNQAVNKYRYEKRRVTENIVWEDDGKLKNSLSDSRDIWSEIQQNSINEVLHGALNSISEKYKKVIALSYFHDMSYLEIASELERPINTVGTMLNRGRKLLKRELVRMGISCDVAMVHMEKNLG